ncbi:hypothetical protein LBMAG52_43210 [Planctomycetia bacterium]|nr:hypothetical protein LBMAG52_43210 [Planctomycetia bacterium]
MKKKTSNLTPAEMRQIGWDRRTAEQKSAHGKAMAVACNAAMTSAQKRARALKGVAARAANRLAAKKSVPKKQRKTPGK